MNSHSHTPPENITPWIIILVAIFGTPAILILFLFFTTPSKPQNNGHAGEQYPELIQQQPLKRPTSDEGRSLDTKTHQFPTKTSTAENIRAIQPSDTVNPSAETYRHDEALLPDEKDKRTTGR